MPSSSTGSSSRNRVPSWPPTAIRNDQLWGHADFVRLWGGRSVSQFGTQISLVATPLYAALALNATPFEMGLLTAAAGAPRLLFGFVAGAWVDRLRRKPVMIATDIGRFLTIAAIPLMAMFGVESFALLMSVELVAGLMTVFFSAAWVSYLPGLVGRTSLPSANSKLQASNSVAQVAGPSLAGTLIGVLGAPLTLAIDACSYLCSAVLIARIQKAEPAPKPRHGHRSVIAEATQGVRVLVASPLLRAITGSHATIILAGHLFLAVYPLFMLETLNLSTRGVGFVYAAGGIGALAGSLVTTTAIRRIGTGWTVVWSATLFGAFGLTIPLAVLVPSVELPLVVFAEFAQWMMLVVFSIGSGSLQQAITPDHLLGRVAASDLVLANGLQPIGAFLGGVLGQVIGVQEALLIGVAGMFCAGAWVYWSPVREIGEMPTAPDPALDRSLRLETHESPAG